jgi:L1 cell adhesion molecule like protein
MAGKISEGDKKTIMDAVESATQWLHSNQEASKEEYEHHQKELEGVCNPIMTKVYQGMGGAGGAPGGMPDMGGMGGMPGGMGGMPGGMGGMPGGMGGMGGAGPSRPAPSAGPKVEEVD